MELQSWGLFGLFSASFLAATILPFSSEAILLFFLSNDIDPLLCLLIASSGNILGGITNLGVGRLGNPLWINRLGVNESTIIKRKRWVDVYGSYLAFFSWIPFIGDPLLVVLGYFRTPFWYSVSWMILGKVLRYIIIIVLYLYLSK
jgi:membrane protein YqaA with SNARE-associated domain